MFVSVARICANVTHLVLVYNVIRISLYNGSTQYSTYCALMYGYDTTSWCCSIAGRNANECSR